MTAEIGQWTLALDGSDIPTRELIGGKAWSIARMRHLGLKVPAAFTVTTDACRAYLENGAIPDGLARELSDGIAWLNQQSGREFNGEQSPLLVSVRSGAPISMPGMMDTVLNLGINARTEEALATESGSKEFARDTHRRFLELYAGVVLKATMSPLDGTGDVAQWYAQVAEASGDAVPDDPYAQLTAAVRAVFESWNSRRAKRYRKHNQISDELGTAVTIQAMVFGNLDEQSGTGVVFSRNPLSGEPSPYGEYLHRAQGEDVVSGKFTPRPLSAMAESVPEAHAQLLDAVHVLEREHGDVQDIEFTVQQGELFLLQTRAAKRAPAAAVRFAVDMVDEGQIDIDTALSRVGAEQVRTVLLPRLQADASNGVEPIARGESACQGVACGVVVDHSDAAEAEAAAGRAVILARPTTSPEDVHGMIAARGVITELGGSTSHAAVVSRALGRPCIVGCGDGAFAGLNGQTVTIDGQSGAIYAGELPVNVPDESDDPQLATLTAWLEQRVDLQVVATNDGESLDSVLDLDAVAGAEDPERLPELLAGHRVVRGGVIESDAGVAAAMAAGVSTIIASRRLPVLLAAWHRQRQSTENE